MADRSSERDRRVRELLRRKDPGFDVMGQAQAEIQDAQSELYNHVAMQHAQDQARLQETSMISQAAQGMLAMENSGADQLQVQASQMNPTTQATLSKFGVKPSQNSNRNTATQRIVTKSGDTTNIKNETITNNKTDIKITQPSIPMAQTTIPTRGAVQKEDSSAKFKAWLSGMFARQQNEADIQRKEYRKKEWALGRTTAKLMKRIGDATSNLGNRLDPKNMTSTLGGQLKWLLLIFGATMIAKVWKPAMNFLANLDGGFRAVFGLPINGDLRDTASGTLSIMDKIKDAIGIKNKDESLISGVGKVFMQGIDKLIDKLKFWFEDRSAALKEVEFPSTGKIDFGALGGILGPAMDGVISAFRGVGQYLGDIITVALGGSKGKVKVEANKVQRKAKEVFTNTKGKQTTAGDSGLLNGSGRNYMRDSDYDTLGNLKGSASSTQAMSQSLISMFNDDSGKAHTAEITTGVSQLFRVAERQGQVVIDPELLGYLGFGQRDIVTLQRNGMLSQKPYRIIAVNPNDAQKAELGAYDGNWGMGIGAGLGAISGAWGGGALGASIGSVIPGLGTAVGGVLGGLIGGGIGLFTGGVIGAGGGAGVDRLIKDWSSKGLYPTLVPADSNRVGADGSKGIPRMMWVLDRKGVEAVKAQITKNMGNKDTDLTNKEFYEYIRKRGEEQARRNGVKLKGENLGTNNLRVAQARLDAYNKEYNWRFESDNPNSPNQRNYGNYNAAMNSASKYLNYGSDYSKSLLATGLRWAGNRLQGKSKNLSNEEINKRAAYLINRLVQEGLSPEQAAGVAGNIMQESGFRHDVVNSIGAGGIAQWYRDRRKAIETYFGKDIRQIPYQDQVEYLIKELKGEVGGERIRNWGKRGIKFGATPGDSIFDALRKAPSLELATAIHEFYFERSEDYQNAVERGVTPYQNRIRYAYQALNYSSNNQNQEIKINLNDLKVEGGNNNFDGIGWLGDSQSVTAGCSFPIAVGNGFGVSIAHFGRVSARPDHYLQTQEGSLKEIGTNITGIDSCKRALDWMTERKPPYVIIALGHNGVNGYQGLVSKLRQAGIKVIGIKMWGIPSCPSEEMSKRYENIKVDKWIDLTKLEVPLANDKLHATKKGCLIAAVEVIKQLNGYKSFSSTESDEGQVTNEVVSGFGEFLTKLGDTVDPNIANLDDTDSLLTAKLSEKQIEVVGNYQSYSSGSELMNFKSLNKAGFNTNLEGTYIDLGGGYEAYVDPTKTSAYMGAPGSDDITFIGKRGSDGKLEGISKEEEELLKKSVSINANSFLSEYSGKGNWKTDVMGIESGEGMKFGIGSFSDIQGFSETAQFSLKKTLGGKITYWIYPSRDRSRYSVIEILRFPSLLPAGDLFIGPFIYKRGSQSPKLGTLPEENMRTDWQPEAEIHRVKLTPKAAIEVQKLFILLSYGKLSEKAGKIIKNDGTELTEEELQDAIKFGLVTTGTTTIGSSITGYTQTVTTYSVASEYNSAQDASSKVLKDNKFDAKEYLNNFGETEKERRKYIQEHRREFAFLDDGKIYGAGGVEIGTYDPKDKSKFTLYSEDKVKAIAEKAGNSGLANNNLKIKSYMSREAAAELGFIDRNAMADIMEKTTGKVTEEDLQKIRTSTREIHGYIKTTKIADQEIKYRAWTNDAGDIEWYSMDPEDLAKFLSKLHGLPEKEAIIYAQSVKNQLTRVKSEKELFSLIAKFANRTNPNIGKKTGGFLGLWKRDKTVEEINRELQKGLFLGEQHFDSSSNGSKVAFALRFVDETDKLRATLIREGIKLSKEVEYGSRFGFMDKNHKYYQKITYEDGSENEKHFKIHPDNGVPMMEVVNAAIDRQRKAAKKNHFKEAYNGSGLQASYQSLADKINNKLLTNVTWDEKSKTVTTQGGAVLHYDVDDKGNRKVRALTAEEAFSDIESFYENKNEKIKFYQRRFGAVMEEGKLYVYDKKKISRVQIDLNKPISSDLHQIMVYNSLQARTSDKSTVWDTVSEKGEVEYNAETGYYNNTTFRSGTRNQDAQHQMLTAIAEHSGLTKSLDLNNELMESMLEQLGIQTKLGISSEQKMNLQIKHEKETSSSVTQTANILQAWADSGFKTSISTEDIPKEIKDIKIGAENDKRAMIWEALQRGNNALAGKKVRKVVDKDGYDHYIYMKAPGVVEEITDINKEGKFTTETFVDAKMDSGAKTLDEAKHISFGGNEIYNVTSQTIVVNETSGSGQIQETPAGT